MRTPQTLNLYYTSIRIYGISVIKSVHSLIKARVSDEDEGV